MTPEDILGLLLIGAFTLTALQIVIIIESRKDDNDLH